MDGVKVIKTLHIDIYTLLIEISLPTCPVHHRQVITVLGV